MKAAMMMPETTSFQSIVPPPAPPAPSCSPPSGTAPPLTLMLTLPRRWRTRSGTRKEARRIQMRKIQEVVQGTAQSQRAAARRSRAAKGSVSQAALRRQRASTYWVARETWERVCVCGNVG